MKLMDRLGGRMDNKPPVSVGAERANGIGEADSMQRLAMRRADDAWDDEDLEWEGWEPRCPDCRDTGKVVAADGYHEYLGYDDVPCHCAEAQRWVGRLGPKMGSLAPHSGKLIEHGGPSAPAGTGEVNPP